MKQNFFKPKFIPFILILFLINNSCKKLENLYGENYHNANKKLSVQLIENEKFGNILADSLGRTLYFFSSDVNGQSSCTGGCSVAWPTFYSGKLNLGEGLDPKFFGTITRTDGTKQTTYKGWPLYTFAQDKKPGQVNGDGFKNIFFVAKPNYTVMIGNAQLIDKNGNPYKLDGTSGIEISQYLTDGYGQTLYLHNPDSLGVNTFTKPDFSNNKIWPIDSNYKVMSVPSILDKEEFSNVNTYGKFQLTYRGWPLYYFILDKGTRGNNTGGAIPNWDLVNTSTPFTKK